MIYMSGKQKDSHKLEYGMMNSFDCVIFIGGPYPKTNHKNTFHIDEGVDSEGLYNLVASQYVKHESSSFLIIFLRPMKKNEVDSTCIKVEVLEYKEEGVHITVSYRD